MMEDPDGNLKDFLDSNKDVYQRVSSHIGEFQDAEGGVQRGIDNNKKSVKNMKDLKLVLPHGKKTLMYGHMKKGVSGLKKNMLFMKTEDHGAYKFKPKVVDPKGPMSRKKNRHDASNAMGHSLGFIKSLYRKVAGKQSVAGVRKERIPKKLKNAYQNLIKHFREQGESKKSIVSILESGGPLRTSGGIRVINENMRVALNVLRKREGGIVKADLEAIHGVEDNINNMRWEDDLDHLDVRIGREVIFTLDELGMEKG